MRVGVIGAGIAGALLGWRLAQQPDCEQVLLAPGPRAAGDATAVSGGAVRGFEVADPQRRLAIDSLAELAGDPRLRDWSGFTECGSLYLRADATGLSGAVAEIDAALPDSAVVIEADELARRGWHELSAGTVAVLERRAGYLDPDQFRRSLLADLSQRGNVELLSDGPVGGLGPGWFELAGEMHDCDVLVIAAGAWTPQLLRASGHEPVGLRTKAIQYTIHRAEGVPATTFVDDTSDLYGKPVPGGVLLGLPTQAWDVAPGAVGPDYELSRRAAELARRRIPDITLSSAAEPVTAVDCYTPDSLLSLRPVSSADDRLLTFTGGSGGAAKTALAASRSAAIQLTGSRWTGQNHHQPRSGRRSHTS